jgi:hypothetical protein
MPCMFTAKPARTCTQVFCREVFRVVHFRYREFLKHVHNLFTHVLRLSSPAGLRLEITCESDKKKMNLIFNYSKKIFLTGKIKHPSRRQNGNMCRNDFAEQTPRRFSRPGRTDFAADYLRVPSRPNWPVRAIFRLSEPRQTLSKL